MDPAILVPLRCHRCGRTDQTVASTPTRGGAGWPPTCSDCSASVRRVRREPDPDPRANAAP